MLPSPPTDFFTIVQKDLFQFLWHDKRPKIKKEVLYNSSQNGGIKMTEIIIKSKALKLAWVPRILHSIESNGYVHFY